MYTYYSGMTATYVAAQLDHIDCITTLAKHRADLNLSNKNGNSYDVFTKLFQ